MSTIDEQTSFPWFNSLPEEIRLYIWDTALPGPRIIFVQRSAVDDVLCFDSRCPQFSVSPLAGACNESRGVVFEHYKRLEFASCIVWFSLAEDFFYLNEKSSEFFTENYFNKHYAPSVRNVPSSIASDTSENEMRKFFQQVRNLIVRPLSTWVRNASWLVDRLLPVFAGAMHLVLADQFHNSPDYGEELTWMRGNLEDKIESEGECTASVCNHDHLQ